VPAAPDAWLDEYFNQLATFLSQPSLQSYSRALLDFWHWYEKERKEDPDWRNLQRHDFRAYLHSPDLRKKSHATIRLQFAALRSFYRFLVDRGRLESSPVKGVKIPQLPKRHDGNLHAHGHRPAYAGLQASPPPRMNGPGLEFSNWSALDI
jgi:site-specific recombinase XerC